MKKMQVIIFCFALSIFPALSQELSLNQILEKHNKAIGWDVLQKTNSIIFVGHITRQDYMPMKISRMRPDKYLMEFDIQDVTAYQAYDGKEAWMTAPWTGNASPQVMSGDASNDLKAKADFEGTLYNWEKKGHTAILEGIESFEEWQVYKIKLTRSDSNIEYYFIDNKDFLIRKKISYRKSRGNNVEVLSIFKDYKEVNGMKFPFYNENFMGGQPYSTIEYSTIEVDIKLDEKIFSMPVK